MSEFCRTHEDRDWNGDDPCAVCESNALAAHDAEVARRAAFEDGFRAGYRAAEHAHGGLVDVNAECDALARAVRQ